MRATPTAERLIDHWCCGAVMLVRGWRTVIRRKTQWSQWITCRHSSPDRRECVLSVNL